MRQLLIAVAVFLSAPFLAGGYYACCTDHSIEQEWLDRAIAHLKTLHSNDPEIQSILDYTIARYNHIGPWDVMIFPLAGPTAGMNVPWCPGLTLDPSTLLLPIHSGALILAHEASHDYWPYFHPFVNHLTDKVEAL